VFRVSSVKSVRLDKVNGKIPSKLFPENPLNLSEVSNPISDGIVPVNLFRLKSIFVSVVRRPSSVGNVPVKLFGATAKIASEA